MLLGLLFATFATTYWFVSQKNRVSSAERSEANLEVGSRLLEEVLRQRIGFLERSAEIMAFDKGVKDTAGRDAATLSSLLRSLASRVDASVLALYSPEGAL